MGFLNFLKNQVLANGKALTNVVQAGSSLISPKLGRRVSMLMNSPGAQFLKKAINRVSKLIETIESGSPEQLVTEVKSAIKGVTSAGKKLLKKNKVKAETAARARTKNVIRRELNAQPDMAQSQISDVQLRDLQGRAAGGVL